MKNKIKNLIKQFSLSMEQSLQFRATNITHLVRIFLFSIFFGGINLFVLYFTRHGKIPSLLIGYYGSYIIVGLIGFLVCKFTRLYTVPIIICMLSFFYMLTFFLTGGSVVEFLIFFTIFSFILIMLLNINPFLFVSSLFVYEFALLIIVRTDVITLKENLRIDSVLNLFILNGLISYLSFWKRHLVIKQFDMEKIIRLEKEKNEKLLLNTLPQKIMEDLRDYGKSVPNNYENTTVLYCAISNFAELSSGMPIQKCIQLLNNIYDAFDSIVEKENCLRIKTSGNIYMAVCGLPVPDERHAEHMINCAIKFINYIEEYNKNADKKLSIQIGLHSGEVVAGIVGIKKYVYDIFGDTVNTACRMESLCADMKVRLSSDTYELVKDKFKFEPQSPVMVKGKGSLKTYYIIN